MRQTITCLVSLFFCLFVAGCEGSYNDNPSLRRSGEMLEATEISKEQSQTILDSLRALPDAALSEGERHYRDFLIIKAADKGYITHTSDSLYLTVKDYFSDHHRKE
ncbi:MAG: hypothetical protein K2M69_08825, partial [Muribaculaceae bacterium]|nr:hypothetical protein [Muribaculaceae bacterium]